MTHILTDTTPPPPDAGKLADMLEALMDGSVNPKPLYAPGLRGNQMLMIVAALRADRATPPVSEEQIASAIDSVHLFSRVNDLLTPPQTEICRYGSDDEDEIVVVS